MNAVFLALFGALCWGIAPLFGKVGLRGINPYVGLSARTIITVCLVTGFILGQGGLEKIASIPARRWLYLAAEAFFATFIGDLAYYAAIKKGAIGQTSLILSTSPLITLWAGWFFLGEALSPAKICGAVLIIIGLVLIGFKS
ncbi:transporter family protein [Hydrogenispora ethanolica]|uniref:Transporter family protein n=1 Tax=Hydrogenispora ethanolica TaxID=1082276 RepID=A0A4R1RFN1_HYDET|nr:EamA family transporter [Hydrogenispora ethanolica]TCL64709.1 transporter family protein [Hydrogenispora ethanolica]